jgi:LysM repeat protein
VEIVKKVIATLLAGAILFGGGSLASAEYYVKKGDTLTGIAKKYGMSYTDIKQLNPQILNYNSIKVGQLINVRTKDKAQDLIDYARSLQNETIYVYGGQNAPYRTDCSGWVQYIYKKFGVTLPRVSRDQAKVGTPVAFKDLRKGDLMFFSSGRADKQITHVGIYLGNNMWISNLKTGSNVVIFSTFGSWTQKSFMWGTRVL